MQMVNWFSFRTLLCDRIYPSVLWFYQYVEPLLQSQPRLNLLALFRECSIQIQMLTLNGLSITSPLAGRKFPKFTDSSLLFGFQDEEWLVPCWSSVPFLIWHWFLDQKFFQYMTLSRTPFVFRLALYKCPPIGIN